MIEWRCCNFYQTGNMFMIVTVDSSDIHMKRVKVQWIDCDELRAANLQRNDHLVGIALY